MRHVALVCLAGIGPGIRVEKAKEREGCLREENTISHRVVDDASSYHSIQELAPSRTSKSFEMPNGLSALAMLFLAFNSQVVAGWQPTGQTSERSVNLPAGMGIGSRSLEPVMSGEKPWQDAEDWALTDNAAEFTVGSGAEKSTFWTALATSTPQLAARSGAECEERWKELNVEQAKVGKQPLVLEDWSRLDDGRYTGRVAGESNVVWLTATSEGRLACDPREGEPGYIEAVGGRIYELSPRKGIASQSIASGSSAGLAAASPDKGALQLPSSFSGVAVAVASALFAGGLGFGIGTATAPAPTPLPPPQITKQITTKVYIQGEQKKTKSSQQKKVDAKKVEAPLTLKEQRESQELKIERDKVRLESMQQKLKEDEQRLSEYKRIELEKGSNSEAVKLVFPKD